MRFRGSSFENPHGFSTFIASPPHTCRPCEETGNRKVSGFDQTIGIPLNTVTFVAPWMS
jgi:hypothetical protein